MDRDERSDARGASEVRTSLNEHTVNTGIIILHDLHGRDVYLNF